MRSIAKQVAVAALVVTTAATASTVAASPHGEIVTIDGMRRDEMPTIGPADAPVTIEYFFLPGAHSSAQGLTRLRALVARHPARIRLVMRPLARQGQLLLPEAALEAQKQGMFLDFLDEANAKLAGLRREQVLALAASIGMNVASLDAAWDHDIYSATLAENDAARRRAHADGVPDAVIGGRPLGRAIANISDDDLEKSYQRAYEEATDLLDHGVPQVNLNDQLALQSRRDEPRQLWTPGFLDDDLFPGDVAPTASLHATPLLTRPLPPTLGVSVGPENAAVNLTLVCDLRHASCARQWFFATQMRELFGDRLRVVWLPSFGIAHNVDARGAIAVALHDAALCAADLGVGGEWIDETMREVQHQSDHRDAPAKHRPGLPSHRPTIAEEDAALTATILDHIGAAVAVDARAMAHCRAVRAGDSLRIAALLRADGLRAGPTIVLGGRIFLGGFPDPHSLQLRVEAELDPGLLADVAPRWWPVSR